nr:MAG TPA: Mediator of RNA polymerase II, MEDIATOR COMPLEX, NUCLEUS [Caudoviricetes sp.]
MGLLSRPSYFYGLPYYFSFFSLLFNLLLLYLHVSNVTRFDDAKIQNIL